MELSGRGLEEVKLLKKYLPKYSLSGNNYLSRYNNNVKGTLFGHSNRTRAILIFVPNKILNNITQDKRSKFMKFFKNWESDLSNIQQDDADYYEIS